MLCPLSCRSIAFRQLVVITACILLVRFALNNVLRFLARWSSSPVQWDKSKLFYVMKEVRPACVACRDPCWLSFCVMFTLPGDSRCRRILQRLAVGVVPLMQCLGMYGLVVWSMPELTLVGWPMLASVTREALECTWHRRWTPHQPAHAVYMLVIIHCAPDGTERHGVRRCLPVGHAFCCVPAGVLASGAAAVHCWLLHDRRQLCAAADERAQGHRDASGAGRAQHELCGWRLCGGVQPQVTLLQGAGLERE